MKKFIQLLIMLFMVTTLAFSGKLNFVVQPLGTHSGIILSTQPVIAITNPSISKTALITLTIKSGTGTFIGQTSIYADNDTARFTGVQISTTSTSDFIITATAGSKDAVDSEPFHFIDELPVELVSFTAISKGTVVALNWKTATETNNYGFDIERKDGTWVKVGFQDGAGTTNSPKSYTFTDRTANGTVQYRLKQIDRDGAFKYSDAIEVNILSTAGISFESELPEPVQPIDHDCVPPAFHQMDL